MGKLVTLEKTTAAEAANRKVVDESLIYFDENGRYWLPHRGFYVPGIDQTLVDRETSGGEANTSLEVRVDPAANTTKQQVARKIKVIWNSIRSVLTGGWIGGEDVEHELSGTGTIDKVVQRTTSIKIAGGIQAPTVVGHEFKVQVMDNTSNIGNWVANYLPNLDSLPNSSRITNLYIWASDWARAHFKISGRYLKNMKVADASVTHEIGPHHTGYVPGRFYPPKGANGLPAQVQLPANTVLSAEMEVHSRRAFTLQLRVKVAGAGNMSLALFYRQNGYPTEIINQVELSASTTGLKILTLPHELEAGVYQAAVISSVAIDINRINVGDAQRALNGTTADEGNDGQIIAPAGGYAAFPPLFTSIPNRQYSDQSQTAPHFLLVPV